MALASAAGFVQNSGTLIPEIWSSKLLVKFYASTVFGSIANTDYEGEIKNAGDKVLIRNVPDITIRTYVKGGKLTYETPTTANTELLIDQGKYFAFAVNDVDKMQSDIPFMNKWSGDAGEQMKIAIDTAVLASIYADAATGNKGATAGVKSSAYNLGVSGTPFLATRVNILDGLCGLGAALDEQNVPGDSRWVVLPPLLSYLLKLSDLKDASMLGDGTSALRSGRLGIIDRFTVYQSNLLATTADGSGVTAWNCIAGHPSAVTFASQIVKTETLKNPDDFGDLCRGLQVYGFEVVKPTALCHFYVAKG